MKKNALVYGLIGGLIASIWLLISIWFYTKGMVVLQNGMLYGYAFILMGLSMVFFGTKRYRDRMHGGLLTYGQALKHGLFIALIISTVYVLVWEIGFFGIVPDFMEIYTQKYLAELKAGGATADVVSQEAARMAEVNVQYKQPLYNIMMTYAEILPLALLTVVISAFAVRKYER